MSSFDRRAFLALLPAALAACGFEPVYAPGGAASTLSGRVEVQELTTTEGYLLVRDLEERLGRPQAPAYKLGLDLEIESQGQAVTETDDTTRYSVVGRLSYELTPYGSVDVIAAGEVSNFTGYSATGSTVETLAAQRDAHARLMTILADQVATKLFATADLPA